MKTTALQDTFHILIACGVMFFAIKLVNSQGIERITPLLVLGYATAIAALVVSVRAMYRATYHSYPKLRDLKKAAIFVAAFVAGGVVLNFLPPTVQLIFGNLYFIGVSIAGFVAFQKSLPRPPMPGDMVEGQGPSDSPRRRPPPM